MIAYLLAATLFFTSNEQIVNLERVTEITCQDNTYDGDDFSLGLIIDGHTYWHTVGSLEEMKDFFEKNFILANFPPIERTYQ